MNMGRVKAIIWRQAYEIRRDPNQITNMIYWPVINIAVWGFLTLYLGHNNKLQPSLLNGFLGAAILWGLFNGFQRDMAVGFLEELWSRNLVNLFASPLSVGEYVTGLIVVNILKTFIGVAVMSLMALFCYNYNIGPDLFLLAPFMVVLGLAGIALGVVVTGLIFRYTTKFQSLAWSFAGILMPVSCVFYPLNSLPPGLQAIARLLPTTHAFEGMRQAIADRTTSLAHCVWGIGLDAVYLLLAAWYFQKLFAAARSRGLLVKTG